MAAKRHVEEGRRFVVDVDLEKFFDRVNHDVLMGRLAQRIPDRRDLGLIRRYLEAGVMANGVVMERGEGTPQGGPLSPLLANVLLDEVDKELEKRGHAFVRYADDCNVYVRSRRAGRRTMELRRRLFGRLRLRVNETKSAVDLAWNRKISHELVAKLLAWRHPGFSAHVGEPIAPEEKQHLKDTAAYLVRNPLSLKKLVYLDGEKAVVYRSRMNPFLGRNFEAMDPLEWLARLSDHIPDPGQHRTLLYGEYSSRVRGSGVSAEPEALAAEQPQPRKRSSPSWGRFIAKVYQVDPLVCTRCGKRMSLIAFVTDQVAIGKILDHLGLSTPEAEKPPPPVQELLRVAEQGDGWGVPAQWEQA